MGTEIVNNEAEHRYEIRVDGGLAGFAAYRVRPDALVLTHTEVFTEGQGLGGRLVRGALDDVRANGHRIVPLCPFVTAYVARHPEYQDLIVSRT